MADNRITKHRIKNHWTYCWWKYLLMVVCMVFGVNLFFTMTAYKAPEEKKVEIFLCNGWADAEKAQNDLWPMLLEVAPDQEEMNVANIDLVGGEYYSLMQFTTYVAAQQGDIILLHKNDFTRYSAEGAWDMYADLTPYIENGMIDVEGMDLTAGTLKNEAGEMAVYGIPTDVLFGFVDYSIDPADSLLVVTNYSGNEETCVKLIDAMLKHYKTEKPAGYDEWHNSKMKKTTTTIL